MNKVRGQIRPKGEIAIIAIGDFGAEMLQKISFSEDFRPLLFRIDWNDRLPQLQDEYIHVALNSRYRGFNSGDPIAASKAVAEICPDLMELTSSSFFVVLIAQPGDGIGSGATTALTNIFNRAKIPLLPLLSLPDAEIVGRKRHMTARGTISELCAMKEVPVVFDQAGFPGYLEAFNISVADKIQALLDALTPGMVPIDFNRIRMALTGSSSSTIVTARARGQNRAQEVAESVMVDYSLESFLNRKASLLMHLKSDGPLSLFEVEEVAHLITSNWGEDVDLIYGVDQSRGEIGELRLGLIIGEYVEEMAKSQAVVEDENQDDPILIELFSKLQYGQSRG